MTGRTAPRHGSDLDAVPISSAGLAQASRFMAGSSAGTQVLRVVTTLVLAGLLSPRDFGLVALAMVVLTLVEQFRDFGVGAAVIQRSGLTQRMASTVFFAASGVGIALAGLLVLAAPLAALALGDATATTVLRWLAVVTAVASVGHVHQALLRRTLKFADVAVLNFLSVSVQTVVSVALAYHGSGVWSLVVGAISGAAAGTTYSWWRMPWRPSLTASWADLRSVAGFSLNLSAFNVVNFGILHLDKILVGTAFGPVALGVYSMAQRLLMYPVLAIGQVLQEVLFPAMSRRQDDDVAVGSGVLRAAAAISVVTFPVMCGAAVVIGPFTRAALGDEWEPLIPLVQVLAPVGALQAVLQVALTVWVVKGRTDLLLRWGVASTTVIVAGYMVGLQFGLLWVCVAYAVAMVLLAPWAVVLPMRQCGVDLQTFTRNVAPGAATGAAMAGVVLLCQWVAASAGAGPSVLLTMSLAVGSVTVVVLVLGMRPRGTDDVLRLLGTST